MKKGAARTSVLLLPVAASVFIACESSTAPLPEGTRRFSAEAVYQVWWSMVESCSGRTGAFSEIDWYVVPGAAQFRYRGGLISGYWSRADNRIVVAEGALHDGALVRHEMLHALLGQAGHSRDAFLERCGGEVVCLAGCLDDVGFPPAVGTMLARVSPNEVVIDVAVDPAQPHREIDDGHFRLIVTVTNPRADSVVVVLPSSGNAPPASFSFQLSSGRTGIWFTEHAWDPGVLVFAPGATRRAVFDFQLADRFDGFRELPEGTYAVRGGFGPASSAARSFVFGDTR